MSVLNKAELYLQQQRSLFGETLFAEYAAEPVPMPHSSTSHIQSTPSIATDIITDIATDITTDIASASSVAADWQTAPTLEVLREKIHTCLHCKLGATRTKFVFGVGNPNADIMVIGEAPGADEDALGEPFVGRGGQLLTKILEAIALKREDVYIANIIKCRPPDNRRPEPDEVAQCEPYLHRQLDLVQPKFILAVGLTAVNTLLKANHQMGKIRGTVLSFRGVPLIPTYHPAALLRNPEWKKSTWEDVQLLRRLYDEYLAKQA